MIEATPSNPQENAMGKYDIKLLIIENDIQTIKAVERTLSCDEDIGFEVVSATCLAEGIDCLNENQFDIILIGLMLPDTGGMEPLETLSTRAGDIPIIAMTGLNNRQIAIEAVRKGAQDVILKSQIDNEHLLQVVLLAIERNNSEKTIKSSHKNYQNLADTANDIILAFDLDGVIRYTNQSAQNTVGYAKDVMLGMNLSDIIPEERFNDMMEYLGSLISGRQLSALFECEFLTKAGAAIPIEANSTMVTEFNNQSGFVMIARDITQHKRALTAVSENAKQLRKIIEQNSDGIVILDTDSVVLFANPAAGSILGRDAGELQGNYFGYDTNNHQPQDIEIIHTDGKKLIAEIRSVRTDWEGTPAYLCTLRDVTMRTRIENELKTRTSELKKTIEELRKTNEQILEQQAAVIKEERLRVLLQIADQTFFDINQPLKTVMGAIEYLKTGNNNEPSTVRHCNIMEAACHQISETLKKIELVRSQNTDSEAETAACILLDKEISILSVEDSEFSFKMLKGFVRHHHNISMQHAKTIAEAYRAIGEANFDLILLDYALPDGTGLDLLQFLKGKRIDTPVIFLTGKGDEMIASKALQAGAYEYLTKDMISKKTILDAIGKTLSRFSLQNEMKLVQKRMAEMSYRDEMTGLYNYRYFTESLAREMSEAKRYKNDMVLCLLDLDHFKRVNDTYGHPMGDSVLRAVGAALNNLLRKSDIACRYGGEEFALILPHTNLESALIVMRRFQDRLTNMVFTNSDTSFGITVSIGLVQYDRDADISADRLIKMGDQALYMAKLTGRNKIVKFDEIAIMDGSVCAPQEKTAP